MLPSERQKKIVTRLEKEEILTINEIVKSFNVSIETVRRDLNILEKQGRLVKIYGGAELSKTTITEPILNKRLVNHIQQKEVIGKRCAELINDGDSVYIDSGTTTYQISKYLKSKKNLTIITNSLPVVSQLSDTDFDILLIGGMYRKSERSTVAFNYMFNFKSLNIAKAFFCAGGITLENGVSDFSVQEVETKKEILKQTNKVFIAIDSSKFNKDVFINFVHFSDLDCIVTDSKLDQDTIKKFRNINVDLIVADM